MFTGKSLPYATAAAAAIIVVLLGFWPGISQSGIAWADVVAQLNEVKTMMGLSTTEEVSSTGTRVIYRTRLFYKDPARSRTEYLAVPDADQPTDIGASAPAEEAESVVIINRGESQSVEIRLYPWRKLVERKTLIFPGRMLYLREGATFNLAADSWESLARITADKTRQVGEREIDGVEAAGFEASIRELFYSPSVEPPEGVVRIWANVETAVPIMVEAQFEDQRGRMYQTRIEGIEWNVPLADELFDEPDLEGWEIQERTVNVGGVGELPGTYLKSGVTLRFGLKDGPAVVTEQDVETVHVGQIETQPGNDKPARATVSIVLTEAAAARVRAFTAQHLGERISVDFNGELQYEITIGGVVGKELQLDISPLGLTARQFADDYLTSHPPTQTD
jgi:outer membrane lipoprotein-sorting protein